MIYGTSGIGTVSEGRGINMRNEVLVADIVAVENSFKFDDTVVNGNLNATKKGAVQATFFWRLRIGDTRVHTC